MIMELRQENEARTPAGLDRRRDGNHNHNGSFGPTTHQTLDHHHQHNHTLLGQGSSARSPDPDRVATVLPPVLSPTGSNPKTPTTGGTVRYRECLKNHAASIGGNVFDGCGEFMPSGEEGTIEALKCAACDCHRNFHRKEVDGETQQFMSGNISSRRTIVLNPLQLPPPLPSPTMLHHHHHHQKYSMGHVHHPHLHHSSPSSANINVTPMNVAYGGVSGGTESSSEDLNTNAFQSNVSIHEGVLQHQPPPPPYVLSKKRFRTKFTQEQKDKMLEFAEKIGWRFQRQDDELVEKFCAEVGVKRQVFKVWMHNNKNNNNNNNSNSNAKNQPPAPADDQVRLRDQVRDA